MKPGDLVAYAPIYPDGILSHDDWIGTVLSIDVVLEGTQSTYFAVVFWTTGYKTTVSCDTLEILNHSENS